MAVEARRPFVAVEARRPVPNSDRLLQTPFPTPFVFSKLRSPTPFQICKLRLCFGNSVGEICKLRLCVGNSVWKFANSVYVLETPFAKLANSVFVDVETLFLFEKLRCFFVAWKLRLRNLQTPFCFLDT